MLYFKHFNTTANYILQNISATIDHALGSTIPLQAFHEFTALGEFWLEDRNIPKKTKTMR